MKLYLGYDGSYTLSKRRLVKAMDGEMPYLSYDGKKRGQLADIGEYDGALLFGQLKLGKFQVVELNIKVSKRAQAKPARSMVAKR